MKDNVPLIGSLAKLSTHKYTYLFCRSIRMVWRRIIISKIDFEIKKTRASARRGTNTPGRPLFIKIIYSWQSSYKAKSLDHEIEIIDLYILYEVNLCFPTDPLAQNVKTFIHQISFKILSKITDTKYRSLIYMHFMRSIFVSHWSIISSMTFVHQIVFKI